MGSFTSSFNGSRCILCRLSLLGGRRYLGGRLSSGRLSSGCLCGGGLGGRGGILSRLGLLDGRCSLSCVVDASCQMQCVQIFQIF